MFLFQNLELKGYHREIKIENITILKLLLEEIIIRCVCWEILMVGGWNKWSCYLHDTILFIEFMQTGEWNFITLSIWTKYPLQTRDQNIELTNFKIKKVMFAIEDTKALGEDGFPTIFYWSVVSSTICKFVEQVFKRKTCGKC